MYTCRLLQIVADCYRLLHIVTIANTSLLLEKHLTQQVRCKYLEQERPYVVDMSLAIRFIQMYASPTGNQLKINIEFFEKDNLPVLTW